VYRYVRPQAIRRQSPKGVVQDAPTAYEQQMSQIVADMKQQGEFTQPIREFLEGGDQAHHVKDLRALDPLFQGLTSEQNQILQEQLMGGNRLINLMPLAQRAHQGITDELGIKAVHNLQREQGLEQGAAADKLHPVLQEINLAADMPFEYKQHLADQYLEEVVPLTRDAIDDAYTDYETRFAGDKIAKIIGSGTRLKSPGDSKERALVINSEGGDVTIGDGVLRSNGKNRKH